MPRYLFHLHGPDITVADEEGAAYPDLAFARCAAIDAARALMAVEVTIGRLDLLPFIVICDEIGEPLEEVKFSNALHVRDVE